MWGISVRRRRRGTDEAQTTGRVLEASACDYPVELVHGCAHGFLASFLFLGPELVCSDPPYLYATRRSPRRYRFVYEEVDHFALLELLKSPLLGEGLRPSLGGL